MAAATPTKNPKNVTIRGRVSFPVWTYKEALARNPQSKFPKKTDEEVTPEFNLLIEQAQLDKLKQHILTEFLPHATARFAAGEKKDSLDPDLAELIREKIENEAWAAPGANLMIKKISDKNKEAAPEAVASIKIVGSRGVDIVLKATVKDESELVIPDPDLLTFPAVLPIEKTVFQMYPGAYVATTLNLFAYFSSLQVHGISAGASTAVYLGNLEGARFGGGTDLDEDEIFLDE